MSHENDAPKAPVVVLDAGPRSFEPVEPCCLRFIWPVWTPAPDLDPAKLKPDRPRRPKPEKLEPEDTGPKVDQTEGFVLKFIGRNPKARAAVIDAAIQDGLSEHRARNLLKAAEGRGLVFRWTPGPREADKFATVEQPKLTPEESKE